MNMRRFALVSGLFAPIFLSAGALAATKADLDRAMSYDGLAPVKVKGIDLAYARPGATLADYHRVMLDPVEVAFSKNWDPTRPGSRIKVSAEERENIRTGVAKIVYDEFVKALQAKSTYQVTSAPGPDVLRVKAKVINLYVDAPDTGGAGPSRSYTLSAGEMTLYAELFDSETGQLLARVVSRREARSTGMMKLTNSVVNVSEAQNIAASWARILRDALDNAHGIAAK